MMILKMAVDRFPMYGTDDYHLGLNLCVKKRMKIKRSIEIAVSYLKFVINSKFVINLKFVSHTEAITTFAKSICGFFHTPTKKNIID